jgi:hypothetical protein
MLADLPQELMCPPEAARWFRRSISWLRQQKDLVRIGGPNGQPLFHVRACRAYVLGKMRGLDGDALRDFQLAALASACGLTLEPSGPPAARPPANIAADGPAG